MTEFEKKQSGKIYDARDSELRSLQYRAKDLMREYNRIPAANENEKKRVLDMLVGAAGKNVRVNQPFYVDYGSNIFIGDNSFINLNCTLLDTGKTTIGKNTLIGPDVKIYTAVHAKETSERFWEEDDGAVYVKTWTQPVRIGDGVWIGGGAILLPGVTIGDHAVIGAGSVVTESIPAGAVACGNPCKVKKRREADI